MKNRNVFHFFFVAAAGGILAACGAGNAPDTSASSVPLQLPADKPAAAASVAAQPTASAEPATPIPTATGDIWLAIDKQSADLQNIVQKGALQDVHLKAVAIRDLVSALPAHATKLDADAQAKLQQDVTLVATLVERLDDASKAGDQARVTASYTKLNTALGGIRRFP